MTLDARSSELVLLIAECHLSGVKFKSAQVCHSMTCRSLRHLYDNSVPDICVPSRNFITERPRCATSNYAVDPPEHLYRPTHPGLCTPAPRTRMTQNGVLRASQE